VVGFVVVKAGRAVDVGALRWERGGPLLAGGVIAAAAVYQLTPLKDVCLARSASRSSTGARARSGRCGWVRGTACGASGVAGHLMAALFALGVLSIPWMVLITLLIAVEKLLPWRRVGIAAVTQVLLMLRVAVAVIPERLPRLVPSGAVMTDMSGTPREMPVAPAPGQMPRGPMPSMDPPGEQHPRGS
jgi:predicted metal-binding membrane protein